MLFNRLRVVLPAVLTAVITVSCGGGGSHSLAPSQQAQAPQANLAKHTYTLNAALGVTATLTLRSNATLPESAIVFHSQEKPAGSPARLTTASVSPCPPPPSIQITNPFGFPIPIDIDSFTIKLPCSANGLFGASFVQVKPVPQPVSPMKLGDAMVSGRTLTFTSTVENIVLQPGTTSQITILPETSTAEVAFPAFPNGSTTDLTANATTAQKLTFVYQSSSGGTYSVLCSSAFSGNPPALDPFFFGPPPVPLVGIPEFFCKLRPANNSAISFGTAGAPNTFTITNPNPDRAVFEPDGVAQGFQCTDDVQKPSCSVPQFTVPTTYQNFIVGNVQDIKMCVPQQTDADCNGLHGSPAPSATSVPNGPDFQLLVADDPTYKAGTTSTGATAPWNGSLTPSVDSGPCTIDNSVDNNGDAPGYTDLQPPGRGPDAEFDIHTTGVGNCILRITEDPAFIITDFSDPAHAKGRSQTVAIPITAPSPVPE